MLAFTQIFRFALVGVCGSILNYAVFYIFLVYFNIHYSISGIFGFVIPVPLVYIVNRAWTFKSSIGHTRGLLTYTVSNIIALVVHFLTQLLVGEFFGVPDKFTQLFGITTSAIVNFTLAKFFVFKEK